MRQIKFFKLCVNMREFVVIEDESDNERDLTPTSQKSCLSRAKEVITIDLDDEFLSDAGFNPDPSDKIDQQPTSPQISSPTFEELVCRDTPSKPKLKRQKKGKQQSELENSDSDDDFLMDRKYAEDIPSSQASLIEKFSATLSTTGNYGARKDIIEIILSDSEEIDPLQKRSMNLPGLQPRIPPNTNLDTMQVRKLDSKSLKAANLRKNLYESAKTIIVEFSQSAKELFDASIMELNLNEIGSSVQYIKREPANLIRFIRIVNCDYDFQQKLWIPCEERLEYEPFVIYWFKGEEFAAMVRHNTLIQFYENARKCFGDSIVIFLVDGMKKYFKKKKTEMSRIVLNRIREAAGLSRSNSPKKAVDNQFVEGPDEISINKALLELQLLGSQSCQIFMLDNPDVAMWITLFTRSIAKSARAL
jgi:hypothetical protein